MIVHVALSILSLVSLLLSLLLLGQIQRLESLIQTLTAVQLDLAQKLLTEITGVETKVSIRLNDPEAKGGSAPKHERFSLRSEIDRFLSGNRYAEEDD